MREFSKQEIGLIKSIKRYVGSDLKKIKKNKETIENLLKENEELESKNKVWDDTIKATFGYSLEECISSLNSDVDAEDSTEDITEEVTDDAQDNTPEEPVVADDAQSQLAESLENKDDDDVLPFDPDTDASEAETMEETDADEADSFEQDVPDANVEWDSLNADSIFNN